MQRLFYLVNMKIEIENGCSISTFQFKDTFALAQKISSAHVRKWLLDLPNPYTEQIAKSWITENLEFYTNNHHHLNLTIRNQHDALIGGIGKKLKTGQNFSHSCEIGYWLSPEYWGKGIMTSAVSSYCNHLINNENFIRIEAIPFKNNVSSAKVLDKCGFKLEGILNKFVVKNEAYIDCLLYAYVKN